MPTVLHVVRHGETDWNRYGRVQGHTDIPLNGEGRSQARALAEELAATRFDAAYSSDLARAWETAEIITAARSLQVTRCVDLREKHFGTWEGLSDVEVRARFPDAATGPWGDGETTEEMGARVLTTLVRIAAVRPGESVLVVTHGGPIRALHREVGLDPPRIANCAMFELVVQDGRLSAP
jgi:broad specificity phosphatase PhoE